MKEIHVSLNTTRHFLIMTFGTAVLSAGAVLGIISGLGQTTSTAVSSAISSAWGIPLGTAMALLYSAFFAGQILLDWKRALRAESLLQMVPVLLQGTFLNLFRDRVALFQRLEPETLWQRLVILALGILLISLGFSAVKLSKFSNYPPEMLCAMVCERTGLRFGSCKFFLDICYILTALLICTASAQPISMLGPGTVIFMLCNGALINEFLGLFAKWHCKTA